MTTHSGSFLCGSVCFEFVGDFERFYLCHCEYCRKDTGSAHAANLLTSTGKLTWLSGQDHVKQFTLPGTRHTKAFCTECGSALPKSLMDGAFIVVPAGSLDTEVSLRPTAHIFVASRAKWDDGFEGVASIARLPSS
jgi:hypothetical protein